VDVLKYGVLLNRHKPTEVIRKYRVAEHVTTTIFNRTNVQHNVSENGHKMKYQNEQNSFSFLSSFMARRLISIVVTDFY